MTSNQEDGDDKVIGVVAIVEAQQQQLPLPVVSPNEIDMEDSSQEVMTRSSIVIIPIQPPPQFVSSSSVILDTTMVWYQNNMTGQVATTRPLSLRQLCRIVGMMMKHTTTTTSTTNNTTTTSNTTTTTIVPPAPPAPQQSPLTPDTQVLVVSESQPPSDSIPMKMPHPIDANVISYTTTTTTTNTNTKEDATTITTFRSSLPTTWQPLRTIPVLREVVTYWYYYYDYYCDSNHNTNHSDTKELENDITNTNTQSSQETVKGPVTCRELAQIVSSLSICLQPSTRNEANHTTTTTAVTTCLYVSSTITDMTWMTIEQLPHLQMALLALQPPSSSTVTTVTPTTTTLTTQDQTSSDETTTTHPNGNKNNHHIHDTTSPDEAIIQAELNAFLQSTTTTTTTHPNHFRNPRTIHSNHQNDDDEEDAASYESDQGTRYIKDPSTRNWIHDALQQQSLLPQKQHKSSSSLSHNPASSSTTTTATPTTTTPNPRKKHKKAKFANKYRRNWIYVTGLPTDVTEAEVATVFGKAGLLDLDPITQLPKIKLYRHHPTTTTSSSSDPDDLPNNMGLKGDASICYARPESVELAMTLLDDTPFRYATDGSSVRMTVQAAKFEPRPIDINNNNATETSQHHHHQRHKVSNTQRKVAKLATKQAMDWDESGNYNNGRITGGKKGLCIIVLKHTFDPHALQPQQQLQQPFNGDGEESQPPKEEEEEEKDELVQLERELRTECEQFGTVEKITFFTTHPEGIAIVKFVQPLAASDAVQRFNRQLWKDRQLMATFWDGVTDYSTKTNPVQEEEEMAVREEEFGDWLETQELPEELQLQTFEN